MRQPHQSEIADVHFLARDHESAAVCDAAGAHMLGGVDDDIDAAAILLGLLGDGLGVGTTDGVTAGEGVAQTPPPAVSDTLSTLKFATPVEVPT